MIKTISRACAGIKFAKPFVFFGMWARWIASG